MIGFSLVVGASCGICLALNIQKWVHVKNTDPQTGQPIVSFTALPMWWAGTLLNIVSEILNLAALGYAPATLVTPLGCLTVVFNAIAAALIQKEPFFKQDLFGFASIFAGVLCIVRSELGAPTPPITPSYLGNEVLPTLHFAMLLILVFGSLAILYFFVHERYSQTHVVVFLAESSLVSTLTVVSARCFASFLPPPLPGKLEYFYKYPDWLYSWGSLVCMCVTAIAGLLLQNCALMYFKASEVVPIYFCMFAIGGVAGSGLAFMELTFPWVMLLVPGVAFCVGGVFAISYRRDERIAARLELEIDAVPSGDDHDRLSQGTNVSGCRSRGASLASSAVSSGSREHGSTPFLPLSGLSSCHSAGPIPWSCAEGGGAFRAE